MRAIARLLAILVCVGDGRRVHRDTTIQEEIPNSEHEALALLLRALRPAAGWQPAGAGLGSIVGDRGSAIQRRAPATEMGRKFENNKLKMAKTAIAYAKKASYIGKKVVQAVKAGGDDTSSNLELAKVISEAKALNVPKDVVDKNIKRALSADTADYEEYVYEAYAHGGVGIIINSLSDNKNRAISNVGAAVRKGEGKMANAGSVLFNFERKGRITLNEEIDEDRVIEIALEADVSDASLSAPDPVGRGDAEAVKSVVICEADELGSLQNALTAAGFTAAGQLVHVPLAPVEVSKEDEELNFKLIDKLDEVDDVDFIEHNMLLKA